jgi:hypothetical protein
VAVASQKVTSFSIVGLTVVIIAGVRWTARAAALVLIAASFKWLWPRPQRRMSRPQRASKVRGRSETAEQRHVRHAMRSRSTADTAQAFLDDWNARRRDPRQVRHNRLHRIDAALVRWDRWDALTPWQRRLRRWQRPPSLPREALLQLRRVLRDE